MLPSRSESKMSTTLETLIKIGAIDESRVKEIGVTRDKGVAVYQDSYSGVIFLKDFYVGTEEYRTASYDYAPGSEHKCAEETEAARRRLSEHQHLIYGKKIVDFGCGSGEFLRLAKSLARSVAGVEISDESLTTLEKLGILGKSSLGEVSRQGGIDSLFLFHVLEHLPDPLKMLKDFRRKLDPVEGRIVIEVPHARDFLLSHLKVKEFAAHTFWSQHLILHTRDSLNRLLVNAGYTNVSIVGVQRYGLANHIGWLSNGKGGGHQGPLAFMERGHLHNHYENALRSLDATDTLVAVASPRVKQ